jgi:ketosteroid isomerase-like protein
MLIPALRRTVLLLQLLLCGCSDPQSPEEQVRAVINGMQAAAEARDTSDLMDFIDPDVRDAEGRGFEEIQRYVRGYLLAHQSVHLLTRIELLEFPVPGDARVRLAVGMAGTSGAGGNLAADLQQLDLVLRQQDGSWKVIHASRRRS